MTKTADISQCRPVSMKDALRAYRDPVVRVRLFEGGAVVKGLPTLWPCSIDEELDAPHARDELVAPADAYFIRGAQVGGHGGHPMRDGAHLYGAAAIPDYVKAYVDQDFAVDRWSFAPKRLKRRWVKRGFALVHFNLMYGHWLTEVFPKLFAIQMLADKGLRAPILLPSSAPDFVRPIIEDVLPGQEVVIYDPAVEYLHVHRLILPPMLHQHYVFSPALNAALDNYTRLRTVLGSAERVFVSRAGMRTDYAFREMVNDAEIEAVAAELGFRIVQPERLPWREQVAMFAGARVVAGEYGSGLHNTIFSPRGARVVSFNWISDVQSRICNSRSQQVGYVLPDDGQARQFSLEPTLQRYRIDPEEARVKLSKVVDFATAAGAA